MRLVLIVVVFLTISSSFCHADDWSKTDIGLQTAFTALMVVDWGQTLCIANNPDKYREYNPILGSNPSRRAVNTYFVTTIIGHAVVSHMLPSDYRKIWQSVFIGVEIAATATNYHAGIKVNF